jgi:hypothetical protein
VYELLKKFDLGGFGNKISYGPPPGARKSGRCGTAESQGLSARL